MRRFARLLNDLEPLLDGAARQRRVQAHLAGCADPADAAWSVALLAGARPARLLTPAALHQAGAALCRLDPWLFDNCLQAAGGRVGDVPEVVALALPNAAEPGGNDGNDGAGLADVLGEPWARWRQLPADALPQALHVALQPLDPDARRLLLLLATGTWRTPLRRPLLQAALAALTGLDAAVVAERLRGCDEQPATAAAWARWTAATVGGPQPQPHGLAPHPFVAWETAAIADVADAAATLAEITCAVQFLPTGPRVQWVCRGGASELWTAEGLPLSRQHRSLLGRLKAERGLLQADAGCSDRSTAGAVLEGILPDDGGALLVIDVLELDGTSLAGLPWAERMARWQLRVPAAAAADPAAAAAWRLAETVTGDLAASDLQALHAACRARGAAGLLLRPQVGRDLPPEALRWWPAAAWSLRVLVLYAHPGGTGGLAGAGIETTLAVWWDGQPGSSSAARPDAGVLDVVTESLRRGAPPAPGAWQLVPLARLSLAPGDALLPLLDAWVREAALQRFGPVRSLRPGLVLELAFDAVARSRRHRSGVVVRGARLLRACPELSPWQAATLADVQALLPR